MKGALVSAWRREELERDSVGVAEADTRAVGRVLDAAMLDAELIEALRPLLELGAIRASEGDVIEADAVLAERFVRRRRRVLMQTDQRVPQQVHSVVEPRIGVLVEHRFRVEERLIPWHAHGEVSNRECDVCEGREVCHWWSCLIVLSR